MLSLSRKYNDKIECLLCPHFCKLGVNKMGICNARKNTGEDIELTTYGVISGYALDPVEKKPLYHFYPGMNILSAGSYGCNMRCDFCQNYNISQRNSSGYDLLTEPGKIVNDAETAFNNIGIAFTYNEPVIWFEFIRDVSLKARQAGLKTVLVSNGFVNTGPLDEIISFTDAFNIDLKAFRNEFYRKYTGASLDPIKKAIRQIALSGRHLEITTLIIPGLNDSVREIREECKWIAGELGIDVPLHLSRYFPMYRMDIPSTTKEKLSELFEAASELLNFVYTGNINETEKQDTYCPQCKTKCIKRSGYSITVENLDQDGNCRTCSTSIIKYMSYMQATGKN